VGGSALVPDNNTIVTVASVISGFGSTLLVFRIQRELQMQSQSELIWIPWADWLLFAAVFLSLLVALLPLLAGFPFATRMASAACTVAIVLVAGYVPAILAHYRLIFSGKRCGPRNNPEPSERWLVLMFGVVGLAAGFYVGMRNLW